MHDLVDNHTLTTETKRCLPKRSDRAEILQTCLFLYFPDRRFNVRLAFFLVPFGKRPALERILNKKNLNGSSAPTEDNASARYFVTEGMGFILRSPSVPSFR